MAENDKFETLGDAYAKYPQSTLVMRKQYVDEKDATIADLQKTNATIANNAVTINRKIDILEEDKKRLERKYLDRLEEAENDDCEKLRMGFMEIKTNNHVWGQYKNRTVICSGCKNEVKRREAIFVLWDGVPCHFCCDCIAAIHNASKNGRPIMTREELLKEKQAVTREDLSEIQRIYPKCNKEQ